MPFSRKRRAELNEGITRVKRRRITGERRNEETTFSNASNNEYPQLVSRKRRPELNFKGREKRMKFTSDPKSIKCKKFFSGHSQKLIERVKMSADTIVQKIVNACDNECVNDGQVDAKLTESEIIFICEEVQHILKEESTLINLKAPITVAGDIHGQVCDLLNIIKSSGGVKKKKFLFLGDYVNRGKHSIESICLLYALKIQYPERVFILRGNHEDVELTNRYGFRAECIRRKRLRAYNRIVETFNYLPLAAVVGKRIFCVHGGIPRDRDLNLDEVRTIKKPIRIGRCGIVHDLLWSDPCHRVESEESSSQRTANCFNGERIDNFLNANGLTLIIRAHQLCQNGYRFSYDSKVLTIFSAQNCRGSFSNDGAYVYIRKNLLYNIKDTRQNSRPQAVKHHSGVFVPDD